MNPYIQAEEHHQQVISWESERLRMRESHLDLLKERDSHLTLATTERDALKEKLLATQVFHNHIHTFIHTYIHTYIHK